MRLPVPFPFVFFSSPPSKVGADHRCCSEIEHSMYVLNVDLWSEDALKEVNLVRHTTSTPSMSSTTPASFAQVEDAPAFHNILPSSRDPGYGAPHGAHAVFAHPTVNPYGQSQYGQGKLPCRSSGTCCGLTVERGLVTPQYGMSPNGYAPPTPYYSPTGDFRQDLPGVPQLPSQGPGMPYGTPRGMYSPQDAISMSQRMSMGAPSGMFTRNLIGSLAASAFRLTDPQDKIGIWFILQDLSVRTEGTFRYVLGGGIIQAP